MFLGEENKEQQAPGDAVSERRELEEKNRYELSYLNLTVTSTCPTPIIDTASNNNICFYM